MTKLKLGALSDDKPVKLTVELPAPVHRDLVAYAKVLERETSQIIKDPAKLIAPMVERFMATDRGFAKLRRETQESAAQQLSGARPK
ncbi:hypothetical protein ROLI_038140 [Roseobacter fucihabitans]|uniref:DUF2274 domain-containing protein n=1 Tax=Roseobacter fucihabitans TaxID=1537242 RepID=A0ABZ2BXB6_9RHOB|nr:DUF2274 domain-containing protein [Roseobacter litoralis]MBC6968104.1 hypothetical protein [Roseobacter litoralis]